MATCGDRNYEALIKFHEALGVALLQLDRMPPANRTSGNFLKVLDELLSDIPNAPYIPKFPDMDGSEMFERVQVFRGDLDIALDRARRVEGRIEYLGG